MKTEARRHSLEVHLDGAFALVIQENKANSILAFSPRPKEEDAAPVLFQWVSEARRPAEKLPFQTLR